MSDLRRLYLQSIGLDYVPDRSDKGEPGAGEGNDPSTLEDVRLELGDCRRCPLAESRKNIVFGTGSAVADLVFVGEAPGRDEDLQGEPFVGRAGKLLTDIIAAMGLSRDQVYICNVIKCRPPGNRDPLPYEISRCEPFLVKQIHAIKPRVICALGNFAAQTLLRTETRISRMRGQFHDYNGVPLMPTYHPSFLLRNQHAKREVWSDVRMIMRFLGLQEPRHGIR